MPLYGNLQLLKDYVSSNHTNFDMSFQLKFDDIIVTLSSNVLP